MASDAVSSLVDKELSESDPEQRTVVLGELQDALIGSGQFIPVAEWGSVTGWDKSVQGIRFESRADPSFYDAWKS
jgi:hypothetical protein